MITAVVEFQRYACDADREIADEQFPHLENVHDRLQAQFESELKNFPGSYSILMTRFCDDEEQYYVVGMVFDTSCELAQYKLIRPEDSPLEQLVIALQGLYDVHCMTGRYKVLCAYNERNKPFTKQAIQDAIDLESKRHLEDCVKDGVCTDIAVVPSKRKVPVKITNGDNDKSIVVHFGMVIPQHNVLERAIYTKDSTDFEKAMKRREDSKWLHGQWQNLGLQTWFGGGSHLIHSIYLSKGECFEWGPIVDEVLKTMANFFDVEFVNCTGN